MGANHTGMAKKPAAKITNPKDLNIKIRENRAELKKLTALLKTYDQAITKLKKQLA
jgi:hypothetical protein